MNLSPLLVDTDVVSFLAKDHPMGAWYQAALDGKSLAISIVTIGEIEYGMEFRTTSSQANASYTCRSGSYPGQGNMTASPAATTISANASFTPVSIPELPGSDRCGRGLPYLRHAANQPSRLVPEWRTQETAGIERWPLRGRQAAPCRS